MSKRIKGIIFFLLMNALSLTFLSISWGDEITKEDIFKAFTQEEKVVTPARKETSLSKSPAAVSVITAEDIRRSGAINIPDLFRKLPGMDIVAVYSGLSMVSPRGMQPFNSWKVAVLIDGELLEPSFYGTLSWNQLPISLDDIERIEVVRSPGVLYGANSLKGVVNIITKPPKDSKSRVSGSIGDYETRIGSLSYRGEFKQMAYRLSAERFKTDDWTKFRPGNPLERVGDKHLTINTRFDINLDDVSDLKLAAGNNDYNFWNRLPDRLCETHMEGDIQYQTIAYHKELQEDSELKLSLNRDFSTFKILENGVELSIKPNLEKSTYTLGLQRSFSFNPRNSLLWGLEYKRELTDDAGQVNVMSKDVGENLYAAFLQDEYRLLDNLTLFGGVRLDYHYISHAKAAPSLSLIFEPIENHIFRLGATRAYRAPNIYESKMDYSQTTGNVGKRGRYLGNEDDKAEKIDSVELGYQNFLFERVKGMVNLFFDKTDNVIDQQHIRNEVISGQTLPVYQLLNSGESKAAGIETGVELLLTEKLTTFLNYTFQKVNNQGLVTLSPDGRFGEDFAPENKVNAGGNYSLTDDINLSISYHFVDEVKWERPVWSAVTGSESVLHLTTEPYHLWNINVAYQSPSKDFEASLGIFNLFDYRHREWITTGDGAEAGAVSRRAIAKLTYRF